MLSVGRAASSSLRLADLLDASLDAILGVTLAGAAEVWLVESDELVLERQRGPDVEGPRDRTRVRLGEGILGVAAQSGRPLLAHDVADEPHLKRPPLAELGFRSFCAFPLTQRGQTLGVLLVADKSSTALSCDVERRLLEGIAEQVAVAIENARLHGRVLDEAVLEERERLGHELHDGLAQTLGYVNTQTLAIKKLLASGKREEAQAEVAEMETTARQVYTDVREAILGLRTSTGGLLESIRSYVARFEGLAGIDVHLDVDEDVGTSSLPAATEIQVVRIVQEALANVRKHSHATSARVTIVVRDAELVIAVQDDGRGFRPDHQRRTGWPHFGLQTMRERAEAIGGRLELVSAPGEGTNVQVRVPLEHESEVRVAHPAR
ncbi:MAG: sensor signal transduction histidine kinase [Thermoleophilia bacterium]|nr:sensor signal transduction histidine kinase [Thermoleophilia bacterium]